MVATISGKAGLTQPQATGTLTKKRIKGSTSVRFTKLRLAGFKSFVDPTELLISDGLTGVVGPNGCGKSNLLEALRWVMGENRPTAMRGDGMEDVIFAGAASRPARNFAEVSLLLDNSERLAPSGFNDSDVLEIVRRITRDAGSAYKASGKDVRARDVQMLFADASTGAHSPSLVRQGQISELINAKPKNRRRILEEAAGISGLYQRRHEAELKLNSTETNLARVDDVLEQMAQQLSQLARQARHAARYRAIAEELRTAESMLLFLRWRDAEQACLASDAELRERTLAAAKAEAAARDAEKVRGEADEKLPPLREEEAVSGAILQRLLVERDTLDQEEDRARERIETLNNRLEQLALDMERETGLNRDAGETIRQLETEKLALNEGQEGHSVKLEAAESEARNAAAILQARESDLSQKTEDVARLAARHQSAHRFMSDCQTNLEKNEKGAQSARTSLGEAKEVRTTAQQHLDEAQRLEKNAVNASEQSEEKLRDAEAQRAQAQSLEAEARARRSEAEGEANALRAEVSALSKLVDRETSEVTQIIDQLQVQSGFEKAIGAALSDDLRTAEIEASDVSTGWVPLPPYETTAPLPKGARPLSDYVASTPVLSRRMSQIGLVTAPEGGRLQSDLAPGQRLVTQEGDLWRWDGYKVLSSDVSSSAALRLEQMNRLSELKNVLDLAEEAVNAARAAHESAARQLSEATDADRAARDARREADKAMADASRALSRAEADGNLAQSRLESLELTVARHEEEAMEARIQLQAATKAVEELGDLDTARRETEDIKTTVEASRMTMMTKRSACDELRREGEARLKRMSEIEKEMNIWRHRLQTAEQRSAELLQRQSETEETLKEANLKPDEIAQKRTKIDASVIAAQTRCKEAGDALALGETTQRESVQRERDAERAASEAREERAVSQARADAARDQQAKAASRIEEDLGQTPQLLLAKLNRDADKMPPAEDVEAEVGRLKRQRDALGAVNLRAEEDAKEVEAEYTSLASEKADLEEAVKALRNGISNLNREGRERLLTAFEQVNSNFGMLFKHLFGGGEADLVMVESDDPLEAGLEIMCQPPGKKLSTMSLLSGGEQTLTALALIFAVFLANPAPICVLDEVDAPLDDANVTRFCDMLDEMCRRTDTRFLIITHHAVTMARMDRLFGVTMQEQGVSQLVSVDLKRAETMVA